MHEELSKVIHSFVKRSVDKYGQETQLYLKETAEAMWNVNKQILSNVSSEKSPSVTLVKFDPDAENKIVAAMLYTSSKLSMKQLMDIVGRMGKEEKLRVMHEYMSRRKNRRHKPGRALENVHYTFDILANFGAYRDLHRHRMLTQERQDLTTEHGFDIPKEIVEAGFESEFIQAMQMADDAFKIISKDFPKQAQYVVPLAYKVRWYFTLSLREIFFLTELRTIQQGHPDYRKIAQEIFLKVKEVHPVFAEFIKFVDLNEYSLERIESEKKIDKKMEEMQKKYG
jgi:hypothetical protein